MLAKLCDFLQLFSLPVLLFKLFRSFLPSSWSLCFKSLRRFIYWDSFTSRIAQHKKIPQKAQEVFSTRKLAIETKVVQNHKQTEYNMQTIIMNFICTWCRDEQFWSERKDNAGNLIIILPRKSVDAWSAHFST